MTDNAVYATFIISVAAVICGLAIIITVGVNCSQKRAFDNGYEQVQQKGCSSYTMWQKAD